MPTVSSFTNVILYETSLDNDKKENANLINIASTREHSLFSYQPIPLILTNSKIRPNNEICWWEHELAGEIYKTMINQQNQRPNYLKQSPQLEFRRYLVDFIGLVCEKLYICLSCQHLSVYILDHFMDSHSINDTQLHLLCLIAILISAKSEELDERIPSINTLSSFVHFAYDVCDFKQMELIVLKYFNWNLNIPTAAHIVHYYLYLSLSNSDNCHDKLLKNLSKAEEALEKYVNYFLEISLQDETFLEFSPSTVAATCILVGRKCLSITPLWPERLEKRTGKLVQDLGNCGEKMIAKHDADEYAEDFSEEKVICEMLPSNLIK